MKGDPPPSPEVDASRGTHERRELRETAASFARVNPGELGADVFREHAQRACSSSRRRRLYSPPSDPYPPRPPADTTRWHGTTSGKRLSAQNVPAARCAFGWPARAASSP